MLLLVSHPPVFLYLKTLYQGARAHRRSVAGVGAPEAAAVVVHDTVNCHKAHRRLHHAEGSTKDIAEKPEKQQNDRSLDVRRRH